MSDKIMTSFGEVTHLPKGSTLPDITEFGERVIIGETLYIVNLDKKWVKVGVGATRPIQSVNVGELPDNTQFNPGYIIKEGENYRLIDWDRRWVPLESLGTDIPTDLEIKDIHSNDQWDLPPVTDYEQNDAVFWRWNLWFVNAEHQWEALWERREEGITIKGYWWSDEGLPGSDGKPHGYVDDDAVFWRGRMHVYKAGSWSEGIEVTGPVSSSSQGLLIGKGADQLELPTKGVEPNLNNNFTLGGVVCGQQRVNSNGLTEVMTFHNWIAIDHHYQGIWPTEEELPPEANYQVFDTLLYRGTLMKVSSQGIWEPVTVSYIFPEPTPLQQHHDRDYGRDVNLALKTPDPLTPQQGLDQNAELNRLLEMATDKDWQDKGAIARELLDRKKEVRRLKRKLLLRRLTFWLIFLTAFAAGAYFGWQWVNSQIVRGWETMEANCTVTTSSSNKKLSPLTITGKRTINRPYTSLFGQRWVDEHRQLVQTVVNVTGDKLVVMGLTDNKYWERRIATGERGVQILKDAEKYIFVTDQGSAAATYDGFCRPKDLQQADTSDPEMSVIN